MKKKKKTATKSMTIEEALQVYSEADEGYGFENRAYPACVGHLNGVVAIADETGENGSSLEMYLANEFIAWMQTARDAVGRGDCDDLTEAINEYRIPSGYAEDH